MFESLEGNRAARPLLERSVALDPDFAVTWLQPGTRFGLLQTEIRGTRRDNQPHLGKTFFSPSFGMLDDRFGVSWMVVTMPTT